MGAESAMVNRKQVEDFVRNWNEPDELEKLALEVADMSFKAGRAQGIDVGRLDVVEWINDTDILVMLSPRVRREWQALMTKWGIKKEENNDNSTQRG